MKYLLDVNLLLAAIWSNHSRHTEAFTWIEVCGSKFRGDELRESLTRSDFELGTRVTRPSGLLL